MLAKNGTFSAEAKNLPLGGGTLLSSDKFYNSE